MHGVLPSEGADPIPVGKIPDGAVQVAKGDEAAGSTTAVHTVTQGKTFYLSVASLSAENRHSAVDWAYFQVVDENKDVQYRFAKWLMVAGSSMTAVLTFSPPLEIPSEWDVHVQSLESLLHAYLFVHGYEK